MNIARVFATATIVCCVFASSGWSAPLTVVSVSAEGNLWLAGMPVGTVSFTDSVPANSPSLAGITISGGQVLTFGATGLADHCGNFACGADGPEGEVGTTSHFFGSLHGISNITAPLDGLIGVFLGPGVATLSPAPLSLSFATAAQRDFATLMPLLQQSFFIGDGRRADGTSIQTFIAPVGATRLYLGVMDGFGWTGNSGGFQVAISSPGTAVPEPATLLLLAGAAATLARRRRARQGAI